MPLENLSDGLLLEIAQWVGAGAYHSSIINIIAVRRTQFLGSLAQCSRRLNTIASPLLYKTFTQTKKEALPAFLRPVLEKPKIGEGVRKFVATEIREDAGLEMSIFSANRQIAVDGRCGARALACDRASLVLVAS
jgi:hypothetical protein